VETGVSAAGEWTADGVDLDHVLTQLSEFSDEASRDPSLSLTGSLNILAIVDSPKQSEECSELITGLANAQPSRAIVLQIGQNGEASSSVTAQCRLLPGSGRQVCVEHVALTVPDSPPMLGSIATRLLRPELPTHLWWRGLPQRPLLETLAPLACRLLTEAEKAGDAREALIALADLTKPPLPAVGDLGWAATTPWRQLLLGLLDEEAWRSLESGPSRLVLTAGGSCLRAWLIGGWLASIVGPSLEVEVTRSGPEEVVTDITLEGPRGGMAIVASGGTAVVEVEGPSLPRRRRSLALPRRRTGELLAGELELRQSDRPFEAALVQAVELAA
jgi:glucose-6-phosphate dehydrogenase assembly protein OpcA